MASSPNPPCPFEAMADLSFLFHLSPVEASPQLISKALFAINPSSALLNSSIGFSMRLDLLEGCSS